MKLFYRAKVFFSFLGYIIGYMLKHSTDNFEWLSAIRHGDTNTKHSPTSQGTLCEWLARKGFGGGGRKIWSGAISLSNRIVNIKQVLIKCQMLYYFTCISHLIQQFCELDTIWYYFTAKVSSRCIDNGPKSPTDELQSQESKDCVFA